MMIMTGDSADPDWDVDKKSGFWLTPPSRRMSALTKGFMTAVMVAILIVRFAA